MSNNYKKESIIKNKIVGDFKDLKSNPVKRNSLAKEYAIISFGVLLVSAGVYFFKFPNHFSTGGVSGISILLAKLIPIHTSNIMAVINILLLLIGFLVLGKSFGIKTLYASLLLSGTVSLLAHIYPMYQPFTREPLMELVFSVVLPAVGSAILFNHSASTGGTDIIAMILKKYTALDIGKSLFVADATIAILAGFFFGIETGLFSILGLLAKAVVLDNVMEGINIKKYFTIITDSPDEICNFIHDELGRGATRQNCTGTYGDIDRYIVTSVVNRSQAKQLKDYLAQEHRGAFVVITNSSNILGKGFRTTI